MICHICNNKANFVVQSVGLQYWYCPECKVEPKEVDGVVFNDEVLMVRRKGASLSDLANIAQVAIDRYTKYLESDEAKVLKMRQSYPRKYR